MLRETGLNAVQLVAELLQSESVASVPAKVLFSQGEAGHGAVQPRRCGSWLPRSGTKPEAIQGRIGMHTSQAKEVSKEIVPLGRIIQHKQSLVAS